MLKTVKVNNFKSVCTWVLKLDKHGLIIERENKAGKTTMLNAIHWALTGKTLEGSTDNSAIIPLGSSFVNTSVTLEFDNFTLVRGLYQPDPSVSVSSYINIDGERIATLKQADAIINAKLGLTDIALTQPRDFEIKSFLLNPLYFDSLAPSVLRKFFYKMANIDLACIFESLSAPIKEAVLETKKDELDPYILLDELATTKRENKKKVDALKIVMGLVKPTKRMSELLSKFMEENVKISAKEVLVKEYANNVNRILNNIYNEHNISIRLLEESPKDKTYKEVCYPLLKNELPFSQGSYAEKTVVAVKFVTMFAITYKIAPLPLLIDNLESLDNNSMDSLIGHLTNSNVQYIGAKVKGE